MLKRLTVAVAALFVLASSAFGAGTVPGFNLTPQFDLTGRVAPGCKLYIIQAGTTSTPQTAYQDSGLTLPASGGSTLTCDAAGRLPQWFVADGSIKLRLTKSDGTQIFTQDNLLVVGASSGGGGGSPVDPTTVIATGDVKYRYGSGILTGFVRANGRTIGSATSGATERANSDAQTLFEYLWTTDPNLSVSTGRGASANADWIANKQLTLPDFRGRIAISADDMGNTVAGRVTTALSAINGTCLGCSGGSQTKVIVTANLPSLAHTHPISALPARRVDQIAAVSTTTASLDVVRALNAQGNITDSTDPGGTSTPMTIMPPGIIITTYLKL
jgi:microcystin-dependent protein